MSDSNRVRLAASPALRLWLVGVAAVYVVVTLTGVTTSSLAVPYLSEARGENAPGVLVGTPRIIRSDEYFRGTPWLLGLMARGDDGFAPPLAFPDVALAAPTARDVPSALLHWEALAAKAADVLPDALVFAAVWWFPVALVAALLPLWLVRLDTRPGIAVATTCLVLLAPVNHWWSWGPVGVLSAPLLGSVLTLAGLDRWRGKGMNVLSLGAFALAALCVAKTALGYAPWTVPLGAAVFLPTLAAALAPGGRRLGLVCLGGVFVAGIGLAVALTAQSGAIEVIADTVYPGARRSIGEFVGLASLFGAPHLWILQAAPELIGGKNESELAGSYLVLALPSAVVALGVRWREVAGRAPALAAGAVLVACLTWVVVDWPSSVGSRLVPLTLVPPERLAQALGIVATIAFGLVLSAWAGAPRLDRRPVALAAGALTALATAFGGRALRDDALPTLPWAAIVLVAAVVGLAVGLAVWRPDRRAAIAALPALAVLVVIATNPIQRGLGDLRSSTAAAAVSETGRSLGERARWASDDPSFDSLLMAAGQSALTGQQWVGPDDDAWSVLDPTGRARDAWNRGAAFVSFRWKPGEATRIDPLERDVIRVRVDPCAPELERLGLTLVVSRRPLQAPCLTLKRRIPWGYAVRWVYGIDPR